MQLKPKEFKRYGLELASLLDGCDSATDLDSVADHGFDHKRVLEVTDAVALLCLPPVDAWNREGDTRCLLRCGYWLESEHQPKVAPPTGARCGVFKSRICTGRSFWVISTANQERIRHRFHPRASLPPPQCGCFSDSHTGAGSSQAASPRYTRARTHTHTLW